VGGCLAVVGILEACCLVVGSLAPGIHPEVVGSPLEAPPLPSLPGVVVFGQIYKSTIL